MSGKEPDMVERRKLSRRNFSYYMRLMNDKTGELVGHLTDISTNGFKVDSLKVIPANVDFSFRIELTGEVANKTYMVFGARSRWCEHDRFDPNSYNVGFQITNITPADLEIFSRMFEKYGSRGVNNTSLDYLWK
jgi:hypothetical protein